MMELINNQCVTMNTDVIQKYSIPPFYAGAYQVNPAFLPIERLCIVAEQALNGLEQSLINNMKCATPFLTKFMPAMQPPVDKVMLIGTQALSNVTREFTETGKAVQGVIAYLTAMNIQIIKCQISIKLTQNECISNYVSSIFNLNNYKPIKFNLSR